MTGEQPSRPPAYEVLLRTRNLAADHALVAALAELEDAIQPVALSVLLARDHDPALAGVVRGFEGYGHRLRQLVVRHADGLSAGARICITSDDVNARRAAIALIQASGSGKLAYLLAEALKHACPKTAELAARALFALTERIDRRGPRPAHTRSAKRHGDADHLAAALRNALASWPLHFRAEVVVAVAMLARDLEGAILKAAAEARGNLPRAFNNAVAAMPDARMAGYALRVLRSDPLRAAAAKLLGDNEDAQFGRALLADAWMLSDEPVRRSCGRVRQFACLAEDAEVLQYAHAGWGRQAVRLLIASGMRSADRVGRLRRLNGSPNEALARAAGWALIADQSSESEQALRAMAARKENPLAYIARLELRRRQNRPFHTPVAAAPVAQRASSPISAFQPYWEAFDSLPPDSRRGIGLTVQAGVSDFAALLRHKLAMGAAGDRVRALAIVRTLDLVENFEEEVCHAARDRDNVVRSLAVSLLGGLDRASSRRILRGALDDPDERVQANAVEALDRLGGPDVPEQLAAKLASTNSRVRANAVRALLGMQLRDGAVHLLAMLRSGTNGDRVSALWVVERMGLTGLMARMRSLAETDPDPRVRRRAQRVLRAGRSKSDAPKISAEGMR